MPAVLDKEVFAGVHPRVHVVVLDGSSGPLQDPVSGISQHKDRSVAALLDAARYDPGK